jgi:glycosyltransferase involved in cell wall biosynthesis
MDVKILLPTFKNDLILEKTLCSLSACFKPDCACQVVVIENGVMGKAREAVSRYNPGSNVPMSYYYSESVGKSATLNNYIFNHVDSEDFLIFTDDDVRFNENWVINYVVAFRENGDRYFYGSGFYAEYEKDPDPRLMRYFPQSARGFSDDDFRKLKKPFFLGFNWAAYAKNIKDIGGFDVRFGPGSTTGATGQETMAQIRLFDAGIQPFLVENNYVWHWVPKEKSSFSWLKKRYYGMGLAIKLSNRPFGFFYWIKGALRRPFAVKRYILFFCALKGYLGKSSSSYRL